VLGFYNQGGEGVYENGKHVSQLAIFAKGLFAATLKQRQIFG